MEQNTSLNEPEGSENRIIRAWQKTFLSLRNRNYRLFFIGQTISNTGNWLTNVALTLLVLKLTGSGLAVGILSSCQFGPILFLSALGGTVADRYDKHKMLIVSQSLEMLQSVGLAILAFMPHPPVVWLYVLALFGGVVLAFDNPFRRSFVTEMVQPQDLPNAVVLYSVVSNVARVFGPALAGLLVVTLGYGWCFTLDAASYLVVLVCLLLMRPPEFCRQPVLNKKRPTLKEGVRYILSMPSLWISYAMLTAIALLTLNFSVNLPLLFTGALRCNYWVFTLMYSIFSLGAVVSGLLIASRNLIKIRHILWGAVSLGGAMILLGLSPGLGSAIPAVFLLGITSVLYMTSNNSLVQVKTKPEFHGRLLGIQTMLMVGISLFGGPLCGWLADLFNTRAPVLIGGAVCLAAAAFGYLAARKYAFNR